MNESATEIVARLSQVDGDVLLQALAQALKNEAKPDDSPKTCPHCGYNLVPDRLMIRDNFVIDPRGKIFYGEMRVHLTSTEVQILASLMKSKGGTVEYEALAARTVNARKCDPRLILRQHVHNIRKKLEKANVPDPVKPEHGIGYFWNMDKET